VTGARWGDGYGPRGTGFHWGVDLFKPLGTPVVTVQSGTVRNVPNEGSGGNVVYLTAADGTVFQFAHLQDFVGGDRRVAQGDVIGHVGQTGNATAVHLHFEIRIGGLTGNRVDPAPTLRAAGC
jgi:murein DD-endopeptidase MepM/ murein hydrolase activator NlpD